MNRQMRRHPTHPLLPVLENSKTSVIPKREAKNYNVTQKQPHKRRKI